MLKKHAQEIWSAAIRASLPDEAVEKALSHLPHTQGRLITVAIGKAAWQMAYAASRRLASRIDRGIVITKYGHARAPIPSFDIYEAGHPVPDENTLLATEKALEMTASLRADDTVLFLVSGGGSALFESVPFPLEELQSITSQLLARGAAIEEINTVRKHLSNVKGGRFAAHCAPAHVFTVVLSDVLGDRLDTIASGPSAPDLSTAEDAAETVARYGVTLSDTARAALSRETPKTVHNASHFIGGSVRELCRAAEAEAKRLGYKTVLLTDDLTCEASEAGKFLAAVARTHQNAREPLALIAGGETVVHLKGNGLGGRNQELALAAAQGIAGIGGVAIFSVGSDGTDGPTDAAGGYVDGKTVERLKSKGISVAASLANNDAYHALAACDGLIFTGATGTNVNDVAAVLIHPIHH